MKRTLTLGWSALLALLLTGAAPGQQPLEYVRQGNDAFEQEEFATALELYGQAEERITDPGLVAYNQAVTFYRLERFREAEQHFRRSLEGAHPTRKAHSYFGLANALVKEAEDKDVAALEAAVASYRLCRRQPDIDADLLARVNHNLELARLLLLQARAKAAERPKTQEPGNQTQEDKKKSKEAGNDTGDDPGDNGKAQPDNGDSQKPNGGKEKPGPTDQTTPGRGRVPTLPDEEKLVPLSPEDVQAYLQRAVRRIEQERRQAWQSASQPSRSVKDW